MSGGLVSIAALATVVNLRSPAPANPALPLDPADARAFVQARGDWAARTPQGLRSALAELALVIRREPRFAPAYAALADAYILSPEFDSMAQGVAFTKAEGAARAALAIDPTNAGGNRAMGFLAYWRRHDIPAARAYFSHALAADPSSAQTRLWYGNILVANEEVADGLAELRKAALLDPDSAVIRTDYAWASWENGSSDEEETMLRTLETAAPVLSSPPYYLAQIAFSRGDVAGYLGHARLWAARQGDAQFIAHIQAEQAAFAKGGEAAVLDLIASNPAQLSEHMYDSVLWPAGAASLAGRRDRMLDLLTRAEATGETWAPKRWERALFAPWSADAEVQTHLRRLFRPEQPKSRLGGAG